MLICFDLAWLMGFLASAIAPWLSVHRTIESNLFPGPCPKSSRNWPIHLSSLVASARAMYSASVVDSATVTWRLLLHVIAPLFNMTTYPVVDLCVLISPAQSASERAVSFIGGL